MELDLTTSGAEIPGAANGENTMGSFPPTWVGIGESGEEWEGVETSSLEGTGGGVVVVG